LYDLLDRVSAGVVDLLYRNYALAAQEVHELSQRGSVTVADLHVTRARSQKPSLMLGGNRAYADGVLPEPRLKRAVFPGQQVLLAARF